MAVLVQRNANTSRLLRECLQDGLTNPPDGVRDELDALIGIELLHGLEQTLVADGHELGEVEPMPLVLLHVRDDEAKVGRDQPLGRLLVPVLRQPSQPALFHRVLDEIEFLNVLEVLVKR